MNLLTEQEAFDKGLWPLTLPYRPKQEAMWDKVIADMERGNIPYALVTLRVEHEHGAYDGVEVWRGNI
tara:strand:+ start:178 stop:381 length:204 start_codon:yes stop_codon:yes gene_type:complete